MKIRSLLRTAWEAINYPPNSPAPEMKAMLEAKGYRFETINLPPTIPSPHITAASIRTVYNKAGQVANYGYSGNPASEQYRRDYKEAQQAYRATWS